MKLVNIIKMSLKQLKLSEKCHNNTLSLNLHVNLFVHFPNWMKSLFDCTFATCRAAVRPKREREIAFVTASKISALGAFLGEIRLYDASLILHWIWFRVQSGYVVPGDDGTGRAAVIIAR